MKEDLASEKVMTYFDPRKKTQLINDASPVGISAILTQEGKVIRFASRSLTKVQTERKALVIVWGCEYLNIYLFGCEFELVTDHKPLELIFNTTQGPNHLQGF